MHEKLLQYLLMPQLIFSILNNSIKLLCGSSMSADEPYNNLIELLYG